MSEYKIIQGQEDEIQAGLNKTLESNIIDAKACLQQSIDKADIQSQIANCSESQQNAAAASNINNTVKQIQQVIATGSGMVVRLWENFEDAVSMENYVGNVKELWLKFKELNPWEKVLAVLTILAIISLLAAGSYFTWEFVCYIWPKILAFVKENGPKLAVEGMKMLTTIENSDTYKNFSKNLQDNIHKIDLTGWNSLLLLGMPNMLGVYKCFFSFFSVLPDSK